MPSDIRLPNLSLAQASTLLDVFDALTAAVVREYGQELARAARNGDAYEDDEDHDLPF